MAQEAEAKRVPVAGPPIAFGERGLEAKTDHDLARIAGAFLKAGLAPQGLDTPEKVIIALQHCRELGLPFATGLQSIAVINGRPSIFGAAALAMCIETGELEDIVETVEGEGDKREAVCVVKRKGRSPHRQAFSVQDAKDAKLWGKAGPWQQYPKRMLAMRARGFALWDTFPDRLKGLQMAEVAQDIQPAAPPEPRSLKMAFERTAPKLPDPTVAEAVLEAAGDLPAANGTEAKAKVRSLAVRLAERGKADLVPGDWETYTESGLSDLVAYMEEVLATE